MGTKANKKKIIITEEMKVITAIAKDDNEIISFEMPIKYNKGDDLISLKYNKITLSFSGNHLRNLMEDKIKESLQWQEKKDTTGLSLTQLISTIFHRKK